MICYAAYVLNEKEPPTIEIYPSLSQARARSTYWTVKVDIDLACESSHWPAFAGDSPRWPVRFRLEDGPIFHAYAYLFREQVKDPYCPGIERTLLKKAAGDCCWEDTRLKHEAYQRRIAMG